MRELKVTLILISFAFFNLLSAQNIELEGYAYEQGNRGYLNAVIIKVMDASNREIASAASDMDGIFKLNLPLGQDFIITASKDIFKEKKMSLSTKGKTADEKLYLKVEMVRQPGYIFDVTMAARRTEEQIERELPSDAIMGARIEAYNNTKEKQILDIKDNPFPNFKIHFEDGNHYTIMIRKKGFFTKRMEAYVNVEGCILCFDGVGEVKPGVSDIMTEENTMGTLLANVELQPVEVGRAIKVENIYYDLNSYKIRDDAAAELDKLIVTLKDNPSLIIELGSHTDSRGDRKFNQKLSQKRAESAVTYLSNETGVEKFRITAKGYGESKLVNRCKDGVDCSERRHQKNRRTEIKVTGILTNDELSKYSLKQIIEKEQQDKLLEEILNQEIVEVRAGEELPDEIKKQIEASKNKEDIKEKKITPPSKMSHTEDVKEEVIEVAKVTTSAAPKKSSSTTKVETAVKENLPSESTNTNTGTTTTTKPKIEQPKDPVVRRKPSSKTKKENNQSTPSGRRILNQLEVDVEYQPSAPKSIESGFSGYMVEFYNSPSELPSSHEIFKKHGKIYKEMKKNGSYSYLFGPFGEWRDANKFLVSSVAGNYNNSKVIRYKNGRRIQK